MSGRRVTSVVLASLLIVGGWLSYTLWTYNRIDVARANTAQSWRQLAEQLSVRYRGAESQIAAGVDERQIDMEFGERFRLAMDRFRTTAQSEPQFEAARELEDLLAEKRIPAKSSGDLSAAVDQFNAKIDSESRVIDSVGGRFLSLFLHFQPSVKMELAGNAS